MVSRNPQDGASGFEAATFGNGSAIANSTEIVISFAGTDPSDKWGDIAADLALAAGLLSDQLRQAADYYLAVKASAPAGTTITFTGHSLGGGLASLMAVMFGESAVTFDQAPFLNSARTFVDTDFDGNQTSRSVAQRLRAYLTGRTPAPMLATLDAFIAANDPLRSNPNPADTLAVRSGRVSNINVDGEFLTSWYLVPSSNRIGSQSNIANSNAGVGGIDLHSQALLAAFLQSEQTANTVAGQKQSLSEVTFKLTELLKMIYDKNLFAYPADNSNTRNPNFLELIVNHEAGRDSRSNAAIAPDAMVTRFTRDLWKIAQDDGLTLTNNFIAKALTAFAMQMYYEDTDNAKNPSKELFAKVTGGVQFDMADVAKAFKTSFDQGKGLDLNDAKGSLHVRNYIETAFTGGERQLIHSLLPLLRDWTIQAGAEVLNTADTQNRNAFLLGGKDSDGLVGGTGADLLVGNGGADLLQGKGGNDFLLGGKGADTYVYTTGDGLDTILDSEGQNTLAVDGGILSGGADYGDARVRRSADGKHLYVETSGRMLIDGNLILQNYATGGSFGLTMTAATAVPLLKTTRTIIGDRAPVDTDPDHQKVNGLVHDWTDDLGNLKVTATAAPNRDDTLYDSAGNDRIESGGGGDHIYATRGGNDYINAGAGQDKATGGSGNDVIVGGTENDILEGRVGDDSLYADSEISVATAIANGNIADSGSGRKGDWLAGESGDDTLIGDASNDVLSGGGGTDLLIGGAGDDDILGDTDWVATSFDWTVTDQESVRWFDPVIGTQFPGDGAADVIYAGEGKDHAWGGIGNDVIFGEGGDDILSGEEGNDILLGGGGRDILRGDGGASPDTTIGHDYLDGGANDDTIFGNGGNDILIGGMGNDTIRGGTGRDTYLYSKGDGIDNIWDDDIGPEKSVLIFGEGVDKNAITLRTGSLLLDMGNGDAIHIKNFDQANPLATQSFASFQFSDGTSLTWSDLLARGFDLDGTEGDDNPLVGTGVDDRLDGRGGDDLIYGLAGNDILTGGTGTDALSGDEGDDIYVLNAGDSPISIDGATEIIVDREGANTVQFGAGIAWDAIDTELAPSGRYLLVKYGADDKLAVEDGAIGNVANYAFADGQRLSFAEFIGRTASSTLKGTSLAGSRFVMGGKSNDAIESGSGRALISGGRGNDTISAWGGGNTYLYSRGDGADILNESGQVLNANGNPAPNRIRFGADIALSDLVFARRADGALHISLAESMESITLPNWYLSGNRVVPRIQELVFEDGTVFDTAALNGLAISPIRGTAGDDALKGTWFDDTIMGLAGDDIINGGLGDDILIGGAGADSYVFAWESVAYYGENGTDTIIEAPGETSTLLLQRGMSLDLFRAERLNDDLRFRVRGGEHSVLIKDYFAGDQQWSIRSHDGSVTSMSDFLARPDPDSGDLLREAWNDFNSAARWEWASWHEERGDFWQLLADGRYYRAETVAGVSATVSARTTYSTEYRLADDGSMYAVETGPIIGNISGSTSGTFLRTEYYEGFGAPLTTLDTSLYYLAQTQANATQTQTATFQMQWAQPAMALP